MNVVSTHMEFHCNSALIKVPPHFHRESRACDMSHEETPLTSQSSPNIWSAWVL